tara:strand:- start:154 stop:357 length:204 start_codon:yes stop_codon:yes gene_type:complete
MSINSDLDEPVNLNLPAKQKHWNFSPMLNKENNNIKRRKKGYSKTPVKLRKCGKLNNNETYIQNLIK